MLRNEHLSAMAMKLYTSDSTKQVEIKIPLLKNLWRMGGKVVLNDVRMPKMGNSEKANEVKTQRSSLGKSKLTFSI